MFERFTEKAIKVVMLAQEEARRLGHNYVGTEQILLGLIGGGGVATSCLRGVGVNLKDARFEIEKIVGRGTGFVAVEIPFTPHAKTVFELASDEARGLGHNHIDTEHLLLGVLKISDCVAVGVLETLGVSAPMLRNKVVAMYRPEPKSIQIPDGQTSFLGKKKPKFGPDHLRSDLFDPKARKVFALSKEEAQALGHNFVGTEHLLLGLLAEDSGITANVFADLKIRLDAARKEVSSLGGHCANFVSPDVPFTPRAVRVIELTADEANKLHDSVVGTRHLLLALLRDSTCTAVRVLRNVGAEISVIREVLLRLCGPARDRYLLAGAEVTERRTDPKLADIQRAIAALNAVQVTLNSMGKVLSRLAPAEVDDQLTSNLADLRSQLQRLESAIKDQHVRLIPTIHGLFKELDRLQGIED